MIGKTRYLFDSDVLISSARLHYNPGYCQIFWEWIIEGHKADLFYSIDIVKKELLNGKDDPLNKWADDANLTNFFHKSLQSLPKWKDLSTIANDVSKAYKTTAINKFLDEAKADAWLIAYAAHTKSIENFVIVTNEVSSPESKREIKLPDAAAWLSIKTIKPYDLLKIHAEDNFKFKYK